MAMSLSKKAHASRPDTSAKWKRPNMTTLDVPEDLLCGHVLANDIIDEETGEIEVPL